MALTFDDGPDENETRRIFELLDRAKQHATFFVIGAHARQHPELVREMVQRGHAVASHGLDHAYTTPLRLARRLARELSEVNDFLEDLTGKRPRWFRPPVGLISPPVAAAARLAALELVAWSSAAQDGLAQATPALCLARLIKGLHAGAILLLHDGPGRHQQRVIASQILPRLLEKMHERGLRSVTLDELLDRRS